MSRVLIISFKSVWDFEASVDLDELFLNMVEQTNKWVKSSSEAESSKTHQDKKLQGLKEKKKKTNAGENDRKVKLVQLRHERLLHVLRSRAGVGVGPVERKRTEAKGHRDRRVMAASSLLINTHTHTHTHTHTQSRGAVLGVHLRARGASC